MVSTSGNADAERQRDISRVTANRDTTLSQSTLDNRSPPTFALFSLSLFNMHTSEYDYLFKLLLIGDSGVGKVPPSHSCSPC